MSSSKKNQEQNVKIELTPSQQNPYLARPEDFSVTEADELLETPGHGQHGDTKRERRKLLAETPLTGHGQKPLATATDDAEEPHTKF